MLNRSVIAALLILGTSCKTAEKTASKTKNTTPFGVCFAKVTAEQVKNYNMVIIEPDHYTKAEIDALKATGTQIIAYITLGEVDTNRWYFPLLEERGFLGINKNWNSPYLNLEDPVTRSIILTHVLPEIMIKGVDGLFLDTIDAVAPYTERAHLHPYMVEMIKKMRTSYPDTKIIQNAGLFLLDETANVIDGLLIEDVASNYNFEDQKYILRDYDEFRERVEFIYSSVQPSEVPVYIVDFAVEQNARTEIRKRLNTLKTPYFISNIGLTELPVNSSSVANRISE